MFRSARNLAASVVCAVSLVGLISFLLAVPCHADTIVQSQPFTVPNTADTTLSVAPFGPSAGTLHSVQMSIASSYSGMIGTSIVSPGTLHLSASAPLLSLSHSRPADCGVFSCDEDISGPFNGLESYQNPFVGFGTTTVSLSAASEGEMSGNWSGNVELKYRYFAPGGGALTTISQQVPFSQSLFLSNTAFDLSFPSFDPALGSLAEITLTTASTYTGNVETDPFEDPDIDFSITTSLLSMTKHEDVGNVCGGPFSGCSDSLSGAFSDSTTFDDPYFGSGPISILMDSNATDPYSGIWNGVLTMTYLFTPVPEPSSAALVLVGAIGALLLGRTERRGFRL